MEIYHLDIKEIENQQVGLEFQKDLINCKLHTHDFIEIAYTLSGKALHTLDDKTELIEPNSYIVIEPGSKHIYKKIGTEPLEIINLIFTASFPYPSATKNTLYECTLNPELSIPKSIIKTKNLSGVYKDPTGDIKNLFLMLKNEYFLRNYKYDVVFRNIINTIILLTVRNFEIPKFSKPLLSDTIKDYTAIHYAQSNILQNLGEQLKFSVPYLSKKFKEETGESFNKYHQTVRLNIAASLLRESQFSVNEISNLIGFSDHKYFIKIFTSFIGISPAKFRKGYNEVKNKYLFEASKAPQKQ